MRWFSIIAALLALLANAAWARDNAEIYNAGNALYQAGDYEGAIGLYNSITAANPDLEYNRGAVYLKLGRLGKAAVHFHRALRLKPGDADALANIEYINSIKKDKERLAGDNIAGWIYGFTLSLMPLGWGLVVALSLYYGAVAAMLGAIAMRKRFPKVLIAASAALWMLTGLSGGVAGARIYEIERGDMAVAVADSVDVFLEPQGSSEKVFTFHDGTMCQIGRVEKGFAFITLNSGFSGWAEIANLEVI
ncbi:MAG: tetratricopeptide repeat protein [Nitrospinae bacterium]|nr:tetratricopeptide repeat protein [Nitrospinota bacterium]